MDRTCSRCNRKEKECYKKDFQLCFTCHGFFCISCSPRHQIDNRNHIITLKSVDFYCQRHLRVSVNYFCLNCETSVCDYCWKDVHKQHEITYVTQIMDRFVPCQKESIRLTLSNIYTEIKRIDAFIDLRLNHLKTFDDNLKEVSELAQKTIRQLQTHDSKAEIAAQLETLYNTHAVLSVLSDEFGKMFHENNYSFIVKYAQFGQMWKKVEIPVAVETPLPRLPVFSFVKPTTDQYSGKGTNIVLFQIEKRKEHKEPIGETKHSSESEKRHNYIGKETKELEEALDRSFAEKRKIGQAFEEICSNTKKLAEASKSLNCQIEISDNSSGVTQDPSFDKLVVEFYDDLKTILDRMVQKSKLFETVDQECNDKEHQLKELVRQRQEDKKKSDDIIKRLEHELNSAKEERDELELRTKMSDMSLSDRQRQDNKRLQEMTAEIQKWKDSFTAVRKRVQEKETEIDKCRKELSELHERFEVASKERDFLKQKLAKTETIKEEKWKQQNHFIEIQKLQEEIKGYKQRLTSFKTDWDALNETCSKTEKEKEDIKVSLAAVTLERDSVRQRWKKNEKEKEDLQVKLKNSEKEYLETKDKLSRALKYNLAESQQRGDGKVEELQHRLESAKEEMNKKDQQLKRYENEIDELKSRLKSIETEYATKVEQLERNIWGKASDEIGKKDKKVEYLQRSVDDATKKLDDLKRQVKMSDKEKDELKTRLSQIAGAKLTAGNSSITDLGDRYRPTKIAEMFSEVYDSEWTEALEYLVSTPEQWTEEEAVRNLFIVLQECFHTCKDLAHEQMKSIYAAVLLSPPSGVGSEQQMSTHIAEFKQITDVRKGTAFEVGSHLVKTKKVFGDTFLDNCKRYTIRNEHMIQAIVHETNYADKCVLICWLMAVQDPEMMLDGELSSRDRLNKDLYREYTKSGKYVAYSVWPALFLHKDGPLLNKGVAQCMD